MRVVFFGTPGWSAVSLRALAASRHAIAGVVTAPDRARGRSGTPRPSEVALDAEALGVGPVLRMLTLKGVAARRAILELEPDALVVVAYGRILPGRLLDAPRHGAVNVHFSLLPRHRGASPVQHAILAGDRETGVTTMQMDRGLDTGPVLLAERTEIGARETSCELGGRLAQLGASLLVETLDRLEQGGVVPRPQDDGKATHAPLLRKEDGFVCWSESAASIDARVRAFSRWPPVVCHGPRGTLRLLDVRPAEGLADEGGAPGRVIGTRERALEVECGARTILSVEALQPAGRRAMSAAGAIAGGYVEPGARLGDGPAP